MTDPDEIPTAPDNELISTIPSPAPPIERKSEFLEFSRHGASFDLGMNSDFPPPPPDFYSRAALVRSELPIQDRLLSMWGIQATQQIELGLEPDELDDLQRRRALGDSIQHLFEEVAELQKICPVHKRHILRLPQIRKSALAEEIVDIWKTTIIIAQMFDISPEELFRKFKEKTASVSASAASEKLALQNDTKIVCFDLDDVICDLSSWREELGFQDERKLSASQLLTAKEAMKSQFYEGGRFVELLPISGAADCLRLLRERGIKIAIITARPQWQFKRLRSDTVAWFEIHDIPFDLLIFNRNKVEAIHENISPAWPILFVEDTEKNARDLAESGVKVLLFSQPHNEGVSIPGVQRVANWNEITMELV